MNEIHEANRRRWDEMAEDWEERLNRDGLWRRCHREPGLAFEGGALETIREMIGTFGGKRVCVIGSGDNLAAYALASLGARVTSTDISEERLRLAADRADALGLSIEFVCSDAASLDSLPIRASISFVRQTAFLSGSQISMAYSQRSRAS